MSRIYRDSHPKLAEAVMADNRFAIEGQTQRVEYQGRRYEVITYVRKLNQWECLACGLGWALSYITIIPLLFCRARVNELFREARTRQVIRQIYTSITPERIFQNIRSKFESIANLPAFVTELLNTQQPAENALKLEEWLLARDKLIIWNKLANQADVLIDEINFANFSSIEDVVTKANEFSTWFKLNCESLKTITSIDLTGIRLAHLPSEICYLTSLRELNLNNNHITELPANIDNLNNLEKLYLRNNQLKKLPDNISNLNRLKWLDLENNQLTELPANFGNLSNLVWLDLQDNQLSKLPDGFSNLSKLEELWLRDNQLTELPDSFENLRNLKEIYLQNNPLRAISENIRNKSGLKIKFK